jgi:sec-independent protein translocase protein TatC
MTLGEHLEELRSRIIRALASIGIATVVCYLFINPIMGFLTAPVFAVYRRHDLTPQMLSLSPPEAFLTDLKVSVMAGFILAAPYALGQIWGFVAAGLYRNERQWVQRFAPASIALFFAGVAFLLLIVSPLLLDFLLTYRKELPNINPTARLLLPTPVLPTQPAGTQPWDESAPQGVSPETQPRSRLAPLPALEDDPVSPPERTPWVNLKAHEIRMRLGDEHYTIAHLKKVTDGNRLQPMMRISEYILFIVHLALAFGLGFQVPVAVVFVAMAGIASSREMAKLRRYVMFGMACGAALLTPPDLSSMVLLLGPMACLFELGLIVARVVERKRERAENT